MSDKKRAKMDWEMVKARLDALRERSARNPAAEKERLRARARAIEVRLAHDDPDAQYLETVEFSLARESYAFETEYVREIQTLKDFTPLPCVPGYVFGIINLRGEILSILDLRVLLGLPSRGITDMNKVMVLSSPAMEFGVLADRIIGVRSIARSELCAPLPGLSGPVEECLKGVTKDRVALLDARKILDNKSLIVHQSED